MKTCPGPGHDGLCGRPVDSHGLCGSHARQKSKGQELRPLRAYTPQPALCTFDGCQRPAQQHSLCTGHVLQRRRGTPLSPLPAGKPASPCRVEGCERDARTRGLCASCYARALREGNLEQIAAPRAKKVRRECDVDGCEREAYAHGACRRHYEAARRSTTPKPDKPRGARRAAPTPLPPTWEKTTKPKKARTPLIKQLTEVGPVAPIPPEVQAAALRCLTRHDALDLADALGLGAA